MANRSLRFLAVTILLVVAGCCHQPYPYGGYPGRPVYSPPGYYQQAPGTLVVPPSNAPLHQPGAGGDGTFAPEETDQFYKDNGGLDPLDDNVPQPRDSGGSTDPFDSDLGL